MTGGPKVAARRLPSSPPQQRQPGDGEQRQRCWLGHVLTPVPTPVTRLAADRDKLRNLVRLGGARFAQIGALSAAQRWGFGFLG